jgi:hypothetical protein
LEIFIISSEGILIFTDVDSKYFAKFYFFKKSITGDMESTNGYMKSITGDMKTSTGYMKSITGDMKTSTGDKMPAFGYNIPTIGNNISTTVEIKCISGKMKSISVNMKCINIKNIISMKEIPSTPLFQRGDSIELNKLTDHIDFYSGLNIFIIEPEMFIIKLITNHLMEFFL